MSPLAVAANAQAEATDFSTGTCLKRRVFSCILLQQNSILKESMDLILMRILDHGLR